MTRQLCTRAHTENALAMGPKVPCTKDEYVIEGGDLEDSSGPNSLPRAEERLSRQTTSGCRVQSI